MFSGVTKFKGDLYNFPTQKTIAIDVAGIQADHLLAENIKARYLEFNNINPTYGIGYFFAQEEQLSYIASSIDEAGDDISAYIKDINALYNTNYLNKSKLKSYSILDYFDPFLWYSSYAYIMNTNIGVPMFKITKDIEYLPATRAVLATYGLERKLVNHFRFKGKQYVKLSMSYGKNLNYKSYAIGMNAYNLAKIHNVGL